MYCHEAELVMHVYKLPDVFTCHFIRKADLYTVLNNTCVAMRPSWQCTFISISIFFYLHKELLNIQILKIDAVWRIHIPNSPNNPADWPINPPYTHTHTHTHTQTREYIYIQTYIYIYIYIYIYMRVCVWFGFTHSIHCRLFNAKSFLYKLNIWFLNA